MLKKIALLVFVTSLSINAQKTIKLPFEKPQNVTWTGGEQSYETEGIVRIANISEPSIQIFSPKKENSTGTAVVIAPGGGLRINSILTEGTWVADWLVKKGITAIVLKYRLVPTQKGRDMADFNKVNKSNDFIKKEQLLQNVFPYSIADALNAIDYIRTHAIELNVNPNKIGMMGFSAGGAVTMGVAYNYIPKNRPDFLAPIYPWTSKYPVQKPKNDEPPMFIVCASNDPLKLATGSIDLYNSWKENEFSAELHMYAKGKHGFGMKKQGLPSDTWIERFYEWAVSEKLVDLK
ncbi:alpha/beta hydrolase [Wenyingzhuangia sp. 1_MG-2023]|nr:alpha/beta hydrolase [Wenyingzhuangia sp. 1_MG-2023]